MHHINPKLIQSIKINVNPETRFKFVQEFTQYGVTSYNGYANGRTFYPPDKIPDKFYISEDKQTLIKRPSITIKLTEGDKYYLYYDSITEMVEAFNKMVKEEKI